MISPTEFSSSFKPARSAAELGERASASRQRALHDAGLVRRFNAGDETAFVEIMDRHRDRMFAIAFAMLRNHADAEEIAQDTFIRAHRGLARFRGDASLATWLHRIALNLARNRYWYFFRRRRHATLSLDGGFGDGNTTTFADLMATDAPGPVREMAAVEFTDLVAACMERLGTRAREILTLRNTLNRSYGEISLELGISVGTVKSRIARARERLRELLTEACPEFGSSTEPECWFDPVRVGGGLQAAMA